MIYLAALALAVGFGLPLAVLAAATAQGKAISMGIPVRSGGAARSEHAGMSSDN